MGSAKKFRWLLICLSFVICISAFPCDAADSQETARVVRVGYYENEVFEEGASADAVKNGYAYEYYRKISEYTGWSYEYVYGSFGELYDMLLSGEIDLLAGLAKREDRLETIGYPDEPMGHESYSLVKHSDDLDITPSVSTLSGKKIGVLNSAIVDVLEIYLKGHSVDANIVCFDDYEELFSAFDSKSVDILAAEGDGAHGRDNTEVVCVFGTSDYYLCVNKQRPDLLEELDNAQSLLSIDEPNYIGSLQSKYYASGVMSHSFSTAEHEWLEANDSLRVGYLNNYLPYSATGADGKATGIVKEIVPAIFSGLSVDVDISYTGYDNYDEMISDIRDRVIDVAFPVGGGFYYSEQSGIYQSSPVASASTDLVYKDTFDEGDAYRFAVNENNRMQYYYIRTWFPDAEIVMYPDIDACLKAVLKEEVGATTLNGLRANDILKNSRYKGLYLHQLTQTDDRCFGVKIGNEGLLKLLNRGISLLGPDYSHEVANRYSAELYTYTLGDMIRDYMWLFLFIILLIAVIIISFIVRDLKRTRLADRMKTDFVSNMSHEIRTPITAILGMNEMIRRESGDEKILQYSDNIEKAGESLLGIINDILDFSKIEAGRMELDEAAYSLPELLGDLDLMVRMRIEKKNLNFIMDVDETLPVMPVGDMQKIRQVITNLLTNAVKYTEKGEVTLSVKKGVQTDDSFDMEVAVTDTGIGIREEEMDKLYSAFDRLDLERTRNIEGSGLGLTITQKLLALMGSHIKVESRYGEGSTFSFVINQKIADKSPMGPFEAAGANPGNNRRRHHRASFTAPDARLLIVDDTPMNLQVISGLLKENELIMDTAESGEKCIEMMLKNRYDVVFLDQRMPNMDGVETLQLIQKDHPEILKETAVICLTANALAGAKEQMLKAGFDDYLTKPVNLYDMEQMLLKYIPEEKVHMTEDSRSEEETDVPDRDAESIAHIPGIDVQKGIEYCGDEEELTEALDIFRNSVNERSEKIMELSSVPDPEALSMLFHSIKSTSRAVGATGLSELARELEEKSGSGDIEAIREDISRFIENYRTLGEEISRALDEE